MLSMTLLGPTKNIDRSGDLTIRFAGITDARALLDLADLDSASVPTGDVLVAQVGDEIWAAMSVHNFHAVANPFKPSSELVSVLHERGRQMRKANRRGPFGRRRMGQLTISR
jgi:hypothetical protein